jgi:hypothetical protein
LIVPNGCATDCRRTAIFSGAFIEPLLHGFEHALLMGRFLPVVHLALSGHFWQADLFHALLHLGAGEVPVPVVHCLELAVIHRDHRLPEQVQLTTEHDELLANGPNVRAAVLAKICNRFKALISLSNLSVG